ncbi:MAG: LysR family transcriptional regulator [Dehalococcoidia bacterium]
MTDQRDSSGSGVQITQLRSFVAVARLGSLTRAAEELGYTEPAVHLQLAALGKALGGPLFARAHRGMDLTPLGEALLAHARTALEAVDELTLEASRHRAVARRLVRLGVGRSTGSYLFPHLAAAAKERDPDIVLEPSLMSVGDLYSALLRGEIDVAFATGLYEQKVGQPLGTRRITTVPFLRYHWSLVSSPKTAEQLKLGGGTFPIVLPAYAQGMVPRFDGLLPSSNRYEFQFAQDTEAAKTSALADFGIACVPAYTVGFEVSAGSLVSSFPDAPLVDSVIYIAHEFKPRHPDIAKVVVATRRLPNFAVDGLHSRSRRVLANVK